MGKTVLKICISTWDNDTKDLRELSVCEELGMDILVMAKGAEADWFKEDPTGKVPILRFSTRPLGNKIPKPFNWVATMLSWAWCARKLKPAIITGHDIVALLIGWLSTIGVSKKNRPKLVYDSHEFELGRNAKRSKLQLLCLKHLEKFLMNRCAFSIMVNDVIADEVQRIHNLKQRPVVMRNIPAYWNVEQAECDKVRKELLSRFENPKEMLLMFHGGVIRGRGVEMLLEVVGENPNVCAVILGNGEDRYMAELKQKVNSLQIMDRVLFVDAVPFEDLWKYVGAVDVGMIVAPAIVKNNLYSLPNKFFENIQSQTPIICPNYPAMKPIVERYGIGLTCDPTDLKQLNECVEKMRTDKAFYAQCKENIKKAKKELCWENEKKALKEAYRTVMEQC